MPDCRKRRFYNQNQIIANVNAKLSAGLSLFGC